MIKRYTVFGDPIQHSLSPQIHQLFAAQAQRRIEYDRTLASADEFADRLRQHQQSGAHGCNVTVPHKEAAARLCDRLTDTAEFAGAVNTVKYLSDGSLSGHNTDGSGLLVDLQKNLGFELPGSSILVAGAGGATRGILLPLMQQLPSHIVIANRSYERASSLVQEVRDKLVALDTPELASVSLTAHPYNDLPELEYGLVINATSTGLQGGRVPLPESVLSGNTLAYDLSYGPASRAFLDWAEECGARSCANGLGMLLEQAADSFYFWEDVRPKTRMIMPRLKQQLETAAVPTA